MAIPLLEKNFLIIGRDTILLDIMLFLILKVLKKYSPSAKKLSLNKLKSMIHLQI